MKCFRRGWAIRMAAAQDARKRQKKRKLIGWTKKIYESDWKPVYKEIA